MRGICPVTAGPALYKSTTVHGARVTHPAGSAKLENAWCLLGFPLVVKCGAFPLWRRPIQAQGGTLWGVPFAWIGCGHGAMGSVPGADAFRWPWAERRGPWPTICGGWAEKRLVVPKRTQKPTPYHPFPSYGFYPVFLSGGGAKTGVFGMIRENEASLQPIGLESLADSGRHGKRAICLSRTKRATRLRYTPMM